MAQITDIAATTQVELNVSPYLVANPINLNCVAGGTLYGINLAGRDARDGQYQRWAGDGTNVQWNENTVANLANADYSTPTSADNLKVVAKINDSIIQRVAAAGVPDTGQFTVTNGARGVATITFSGVPVDGAKIAVTDASSNSATFEFDTDGDGVATGSTEVDTDGDTTAAEAAAAFVATVNAVTAGLLMTARDMGSGVVVLYQDGVGTAGNTSITVTGDSGSAIAAPAAFTGGVATGTTAIQFGDLYAADTKIEVFLDDPTTSRIASVTLTANTPKEAPAYQVVYATAACTATRLTR